MKKAANTTMNDDHAREILGLDPSLWTIQFTDEELRMLQEIMRAEEVRRKAIFAGMLEKLESFGS